MRRLTPLLVLAACGPSPDAVREKAFAPFPNAGGYQFACQFMLEGDTETVFGTDATTTEQAFAYYGGETLRLTELQSDVSPDGINALYQAYDYPDFRVRLDVATQPMKDYAGTLTLLRRTGTDFEAEGPGAPVIGSCAG